MIVSRSDESCDVDTSIAHGTNSFTNVRRFCSFNVKFLKETLFGKLNYVERMGFLGENALVGMIDCVRM